MVLVDAVFLPLGGSALLLVIGVPRKDGASFEVITLWWFLWIGTCNLLVTHWEVISAVSELTCGSRYLVLVLLLAHYLLLVLAYLALSLGVILPITSLVANELVFSAVTTLIHLIHLVLILLQRSLIVVKNNLLLWTPILIIWRLLTIGRDLSWIDSAARTHIVSSGTKGLIVYLAIVAIALLLLGLHL